MTDTREMSLGGRTFAVPRLPLETTMIVYPECRRLTIAGLVDRAQRAGGVLDVDEAQMKEVVEIAFLCAKAAEPELTREAFLALPISPPELLDAFFVARYQTGAWLPPEAAPGEE
jgi:hypothetical protein